MIARIIIHPEIERQKQKALELIEAESLRLNHPDLLWLEEEKLGIEASRKIKDFLSLKPYQGKNQAVVILHAENLTPEAQNALLKILEEPPDPALIILGVSSEDQILKTIISRCQIINLEHNNQHPMSSASSSLSDNLGVEDVRLRPNRLTPDVNINKKYQEKIEKLLQSSMEERFKFIEKLEEKEEFLYVLTVYFRQKFILTPSRCEPKLFLQNLVQAEKWAKQNVNIRAILEYLMLKLDTKA